MVEAAGVALEDRGRAAADGREMSFAADTATSEARNGGGGGS
jgi:hypothetical protein